jgi:hypothetical protein
VKRASDAGKRFARALALKAATTIGDEAVVLVLGRVKPYAYAWEAWSESPEKSSGSIELFKHKKWRYGSIHNPLPLSTDKLSRKNKSGVDMKKH